MINKKKKSRVEFVSYRVYRLKTADFVQPIPYDKRKREIPTSVNCMFSLEYFNVEDAVRMLEAL